MSTLNHGETLETQLHNRNGRLSLVVLEQRALLKKCTLNKSNNWKSTTRKCGFCTELSTIIQTKRNMLACSN